MDQSLSKQLLKGVTVVQMCTPEASGVAIAAANFAGHLAAQMGAEVLVERDFPLRASGLSTNRSKRVMAADDNPLLVSDPESELIIVRASTREAPPLIGTLSSVDIAGDSSDSEATLFAQSGLAELLGDADKVPLIPHGGWAAGSIGYAAFSALAALAFGQSELGTKDQATVDCLGLMAWVNWKAAAGAAFGQEMTRQGKSAEWPVLTCKDGFFALVYAETDWRGIVEMIGDETLAEDRFSTFALRKENREGYQRIIQNWMASRSKAELYDLFGQYRIPGAPVLDLTDLLHDPLLKHRDAFSEDVATHTSIATLPHRIEGEFPAQNPAEHVQRQPRESVTAGLPLAGVRVLDLGIITAGAGTGALLADMGAEVLKVESESYPDPFRRWAGASESPLFKFNNRNKFGLAIDLKTERGKAQFLKLVAESDVVVENFRRGVLDRMGLGLDVLRRANPTIVLASVSGQGVSGPGSELSSYGSSLEASSGFAALTTYEDDQPYITGRNVNYPDQIVCLYATAAISVAVKAARESNTALHIDTAQRDTSMHIISDLLAAASQQPQKRTAEIVSESSDTAYEGCLRCGDGRHLAITVPRWESLKDIGSYATDFSLQGLQAWALSKSANSAAQECQPTGVSAAVTATGAEMFANPLVASCGVFAKDPHDALVKGFPFTLRNHRLHVHRPAPQVGEHSEQYLAP
ncbi:MAG: CoA transferase [Pseudomonadota bacterium]